MIMVGSEIKKMSLGQQIAEFNNANWKGDGIKAGIKAKGQCIYTHVWPIHAQLIESLDDAITGDGTGTISNRLLLIYATEGMVIFMLCLCIYKMFTIGWAMICLGCFILFYFFCGYMASKKIKSIDA